MRSLCTLACCLSIALTLATMPPARAQAPAGIDPAAARTETYQRKHFSFFQEEAGHPLDQVLVEKFQTRVLRFDYHLLGSHLDMPLPAFLRAVKAYQAEHAGEMAAEQESETVQIGSQVVTWSDTQRLMQSAYVVATSWYFSPIRLSGPHKHEIRENDKGDFPGSPPAGTYTRIEKRKEKRKNKKTDKEETVEVRYLLYWTLTSGSSLSLRAPIYRLSDERPAPVLSLRQSWDFGDTHYISAEDVEQAGSLDEVPELEKYRALEDEDPYERYIDRAIGSLAYNDGWFDQMTQVFSRSDEFMLKSQLSEIDKRRDAATMDFGGETPESLDLHLRDWFRVSELREQDGAMVPHEIGFAKARYFRKDQTLLQPIFASRDFEPGDSVTEFKRDGNQFNAGLGTLPSRTSPFNPAIFLQFEAANNLWDALDLRGDIETRRESDPTFNEEAFIDWIWGWENNTQVSFGLGMNVVDGIITNKSLLLDFNVTSMNRRYLRQFILSYGWGVGFMGDPFGQGGLGAGGLATVGLQYRLNPWVLFGLDLGGRLYFPLDVAGMQLNFYVAFN